MRILMIETSGYGGLWHYTYELAQSLVSLDGLNLIVATSPGHEFKKNLPFRTVPLELVKSNYFVSVFKLVKLIVLERPDIVHVQSLISARKDWLLFVLAKLFRIKVILTVHNVMPHDECEKKAKGMLKALETIYKASSALICHFDFSVEQLRDEFKICETKLNKIVHGNYLFQEKLAIRYRLDEARSILQIDSSRKVVLFFGAVREYKGILELIKAFSLAKKKDKDLFLLIAGKSRTSIQKKIDALIDEEGISEDVLFVDKYLKHEEFGLFFDAADFVVLPYHHSYGSGALHTALAFSKSVVVNNLPGFNEMIVDQETGFVAASDSIECWADLILLLGQQAREQLKQIGERAYEHVKNQYSWQGVAMKTYKLYSKELCR